MIFLQPLYGRGKTSRYYIDTLFAGMYLYCDYIDARLTHGLRLLEKHFRIKHYNSTYGWSTVINVLLISIALRDRGRSVSFLTVLTRLTPFRISIRRLNIFAEPGIIAE